MSSCNETGFYVEDRHPSIWNGYEGLLIVPMVNFMYTKADLTLPHAPCISAIITLILVGAYNRNATCEDILFKN